MNSIKQPKTRREREVWDACNEVWHELNLQGESIVEMTGELLRNKLVELGYKRGNQSQLYDFRNSWLMANNLDEWVEPPDQKDLLTERVTQIVSYVMKELTSESDKKILEIEEKTKVQVETIQASYQQLEQQLLVAQEKNAELSKKIDGLCDQLAREQEASKNLALDLMKEHTKREGMEGQMKETEIHHQNSLKESEKRHDQKVQSLNQQIEKLNHLHDKELDELKNQNENYRHKALMEIEQLKSDRQKLDHELSDVIKNQNILKSENQQYTKKIVRLETELDLVKKDYQELSKSNLESKQHADNLIHEREKENAVLQGECKQLKQQLSEHQSLYHKAQEKLMENKEKLIRLEFENQRQKEAITHDVE
jgi:DNA repair exonuclease SbcCD ATPase subunit